MDTVGTIKDPSLRIAPSEKLKTFLKSIESDTNAPDFVKHILSSEGKERSDLAVKKDEIKVKSDLDSKDYEKINQLIKQFTPTSPSAENNKTPDINISTKGSKSGPCLLIQDLESLYSFIEEKRKDNEDIEHLHELLEGCEIILPENEILPRNPQLEARCEKLRKQQANRDYRAMTKNVDNVRAKQPEETIAYQIKHLNRQLIAIGQFILSVGAGFLFGFLGVELMIGRLDFGFRLLLGVICALIIALAEIYFLAKKLNEDLVVIETVQVGGPTVFPEGSRKPHQD